MRLTYDRRRRTGPVGIIEFEIEGYVERETYGGPEPQAKEQRRTRGPRRIRQSGAPSTLHPARTGPALFAGSLGHRSVAHPPVRTGFLRGLHIIGATRPISLSSI